MNPWIGYPATVLLTFIVSCAFHGTWKILVRKLTAPVYSYLQDAHTQLTAVANSGETDAGKVKDAVKAVIARIEKRLP